MLPDYGLFRPTQSQFLGPAQSCFSLGCPSGLHSIKDDFENSAIQHVATCLSQHCLLCVIHRHCFIEFLLDANMIFPEDAHNALQTAYVKTSQSMLQIYVSLLLNRLLPIQDFQTGIFVFMVNLAFFQSERILRLQRLF